MQNSVGRDGGVRIYHAAMWEKKEYFHFRNFKPLARRIHDINNNFVVNSPSTV